MSKWKVLAAVLVIVSAIWLLLSLGYIAYCIAEGFEWYLGWLIVFVVPCSLAFYAGYRCLKKSRVSVEEAKIGHTELLSEERIVQGTELVKGEGKPSFDLSRERKLEKCERQGMEYLVTCPSCHETTRIQSSAFTSNGERSRTDIAKSDEQILLWKEKAGWISWLIPGIIAVVITTVVFGGRVGGFIWAGVAAVLYMILKPLTGALLRQSPQKMMVWFLSCKCGERIGLASDNSEIYTVSSRTSSRNARPIVAKANQRHVEKAEAAQTSTCPHCGLEVKEEAKFCPQCGGKLTSVNYCHECGKRVEKNEKFCSTCGEDLSSPTQTPPSTTTAVALPLPKPKRPSGITITCVLWALGGLVNFFIGVSALSVDLGILVEMSRGLYFTDPVINAWASWALPTETIVSFIVLVLGMIQFATIYGFWNRKDWAYRSGIAVPWVAVVTSLSSLFLYLTAPPMLNLTFNYLIPFFNILFAVIYTVYLRQSHVKIWLCVNA